MDFVLLRARIVPGISRRIARTAAVSACTCAIAIGLAGCGGHRTDPAPSLVVRSSPYGPIVTTPGGLSLYLYVDDSSDPPRSTCYGGCAADWPPVLVAGTPRAGRGISGVVGSMSRGRGGRQLTLDGNPLYTFAGDQRPGDLRGEGIGGSWYLVSPSGQTIPFGSPTFVEPFKVIQTTLGTKASKLGTVVTDAEGQTLYAYGQDRPGHSSCVTAWCVQDWPPLLTTSKPDASPSVHGRVGWILRPDGSHQVTLNGHPLYAFSADLVSGDVRGEGIGGEWLAMGADGKVIPEPGP